MSIIKKCNNYRNTEIFKNLIKRQRKDINIDRKLQLNDLKRICKYIDTDIFITDNCCYWSGYVTNKNNDTKGTYINFYFKKKKIALHRLLYYNFVDDLDADEYIKFTCSNKGICCNIHHMKKHKYIKKNNDLETKKIKKKNNIIIINKYTNNNENKLNLFFE
jgi:hypothetical protein